MSKGIGFGTSIATSSGATIGQIRSISGPATDVNDVDVTTLDSTDNWRDFLPGLVDPGEVTLGLAYGNDVVTHTLLATRHSARTSATYTLTHGSTAWSANTQAFTGYVKSLGQEIPLDDLVTLDVTFKLSGSAGFKETT